MEHLLLEPGKGLQQPAHALMLHLHKPRKPGLPKLDVLHVIPERDNSLPLQPELLLDPSQRVCEG